MAMNKELHPKRDIDGLYIPNYKGGRDLTGCMICVVDKENGLGWYVKQQIEF